MRKNTGIVLFLLLILLNFSHAKAEENPLNIEDFKKKLEQVKKYRQVNSQTGRNIQKAYLNTFSDRYVISPGDYLSVSIFGEPELTQEKILVKCDGYANIHPIGEVRLGGFNVDEVREILSAHLEKYFVKPIVSVHVDSTRTPKIYIYGAVEKPGLYSSHAEGKPLGTDYLPALSLPTLAGVIEEAGGIDYSADLENVQVINHKTGNRRTYNLLNLIKNGDVAQNIYLSSGDAVYIPVRQTNSRLSDDDFLLISRSSIAPKEFPVRVRGAVRKPGVHYLTSASPGLNTAIASSKGLTFNAKVEEIKIHRMTATGKVDIIVADPDKDDVVLRPNDTINVFDKRKSLWGKCYILFMSLVSAAGGSASWLLVD